MVAVERASILGWLYSDIFLAPSDSGVTSLVGGMSVDDDAVDGFSSLVDGTQMISGGPRMTIECDCSNSEFNVPGLGY